MKIKLLKQKYCYYSNLINKISINTLNKYKISNNNNISFDNINNNLKIKDNNKRIIVLDDDPTGCQTVYNINLLLNYNINTIEKQLLLDHKIFYILTNTRAMNQKNAIETTQLVLNNIEKAKKNINYNYQFEFISRGDSTLRGHYPAEVDTIINHIQQINTNQINGSATILYPAFFEGGRITLNSVHYLTEKDELIPVGLTPFASDPHFGYR